MNKKPKLVYGIKGKLVSAACMLLVAVIMVVSSTYAWFTLSTAPEVTGIQTAVGANGSLEMALLPLDGKADTITSSVGDSVLDTSKKNLTWGNMVDLSDSSYGLDKIILYPSKLNEVAGLLKGSMLKTVAYGADGRISNYVENAVTGTLVDGSFSKNSNYGVRAVGVASGMTDRQLDYRNAISSANTYAALAKNTASASLNKYGSTLANIVVKKAMQGDSATYTQEEIDALNGLIKSLQATEASNGSDGPLANIEKAYMQYILGYAASQAVQDTVDAGKDEALTAWKAVQGLVNADGATLASVKAGLTQHSITLDGALNTAITALETTIANVAAAKAAMPTSGEPYTWAQISTAINKLAVIDAITVNEYAATEVKNNMSAIVNSVTSQGVNVAMASGAGVYADIADHCGNYSTSITIAELSAGSLTVTDVNARMHANGISPTYLTSCGTALTTAGAPLGTGTTMPISEFYGYVIDLAFRTNAVESNLLLQTAPVDRIYSDNNNEATLGKGSTMTFDSTDNAFSQNQVKELMKAIRVVFFIPDSNNQIVAYAKLDVDGATVGSEGVTANLYLYTSVTTYEIKIGEKVYPVTKTDDTYTYVNDASETVTLEESDVQKLDSKVTETLITEQDNAKIMALTQNKATALSALVYLDGDIVGNDDVAATVAASMTGKMNLQFSSSAKLSPMEYKDLHQTEKTETEEPGTEEPGT